jgi:hypothetical protein
VVRFEPRFTGTRRADSGEVLAGWGTFGAGLAEEIRTARCVLGGREEGESRPPRKLTARDVFGSPDRRRLKYCVAAREGHGERGFAALHPAPWEDQ